MFRVQSPACVSVGLAPQLLEPGHWVLLDWDPTWEIVVRYKDKLFHSESNIKLPRETVDLRPWRCSGLCWAWP